jgi:hypothetical protein
MFDRRNHHARYCLFDELSLVFVFVETADITSASKSVMEVSVHSYIRDDYINRNSHPLSTSGS